MGEIAKALRRVRQNAHSTAHPDAVQGGAPHRSPHAPRPAPAQDAAGEPPDFATEVVSHPTSFASEQYRKLALQVTETLERGRARSVLVTSASRHEGKSTTACNLAFACASIRPQASVLLVELDLRGPVIAAKLGMELKHGIAEALSGEVEVAASIVATTHGQLDILAARTEAEYDHRLFSEPTLRALWSELETRYDLILVDGPPLLGFSDTAQLLRLAERCVVVTRPGVTRMKALRETLNEIPEEKILGVVTNASRSGERIVSDYGPYRATLSDDAPREAE